MMVEINSLFPTPVMRVQRVLDRATSDATLAALLDQGFLQNSHDRRLEHSPISKPSASPGFLSIVPLLSPHVEAFGRHLFGERLNWLIKDFWSNRLPKGGTQAMHVHANSLVSGVLYLTDSHPSANLVFQRPGGTTGFVFSNFNTKSEIGPYNADRWQVPRLEAGDLVLFPSYLMHGVPENLGDERVSVSFNTVPDRLNTEGYEIRFAAP